MRHQLNAWVTSETTQTWKMIHTIHAHIHYNKANVKIWLWRPNDIRGPCGHKSFLTFVLQMKKNPEKKPHPGNLSRPRIEPGPAACQARMLPPAPQRWTCSNISLFENLVYRRREKFYPRSGLEPGPLAFRANVLTNWAIQDMYRTTIELISWAIFSHLRTDILLLLLCPMEACILKL